MLTVAMTALGIGAGGIRADAAPERYTIGVDNATPSGHLFMYTDFFPRSGVTIHSGDVVDFGWASQADGLHTATVLQDRIDGRPAEPGGAAGHQDSIIARTAQQRVDHIDRRRAQH